MLLQWFFVVILFQFTLYLFKQRQHHKHKENLLKKGDSFTVLGWFDAIKVISTVFFNQSKPNYEAGLELRKQFGKMFVVFLPFKRGLGCITDLTLAKTLMKSSEWINRIWDDHYITMTTFKKPQGLLFSNNEYWIEARKLCMKLLHQLDFFKPNSMEKFINEEVQRLEHHMNGKIREGGGETVLSTHQMFEAHTLNIVAQVVIGRRFEDGEHIVDRFLSTMNVANREFNVGYSALDFFPWLRFIPGLTFMDTAVGASEVIYEYFTDELARRREAGTYRTNPTDFTDYFLLEIDRRASDEPNYITDECFLACMRDMIFAGADTTNSALEHGILHVSLNPRVQKKLQDEIDAVIGPEREPSYNDKSRMPYTQAVMHEILRVATPVPFTSRAPVIDSQIDGIDVPKGTILGINIYSIHRCNDLWDDPDVFRPERFLNDRGEIVNTEKIIPFGYGKRTCLGEAVARVSLFRFFVTLMQKFHFELSDKHPPPSLANIPGLSRCPLPYFVRIRQRGVANNNNNE